LETDFTKLDRAFNPHCVAVVGDSKKTKFHWLNNLSTFKGKLYSVQVNPDSIEGIRELGIENYPSLLNIPEPVDYVIVTVPREIAPGVLDDCIAKEVGAAHFFTSGFAETATEKGIELERIIRDKVESANFYLVGPNCRGIFNPRIGLRQIAEQYYGFAGEVGLIIQSGGHAMSFSREAHMEGVDINKSVSFGNGIGLDASNYLEYFGRDDEIKVIAMYLEGVKDGRRFFRVLREVAAQKPVIIWKGGRTDDGGRAIASHTGSMAVPKAIWDAAVRQCGAIQVKGMEELIDTLKAIRYLSSFQGNRVGVAGGAGGQSIAITDILSENGLKVPPLSKESYDELVTFFSVVGGSYQNPLDTDVGRNRKELERIYEILERDSNIDILMLISRVGNFMFSSGLLEADINAVVNIRKRTLKPVLTILPYANPEEMVEAREAMQSFQAGGVPVFSTMERGSKALRNVLDYYRFKNSDNK